MKTYNLTDKQILEQLEEIAKNHDIDLTEEIKKITKKLENSDTVSRVWEKVELARHTDRPRALDYIDMIIDDFTELHGDRYYGDDPAIVGGISILLFRAYRGDNP